MKQFERHFLPSKMKHISIALLKIFPCFRRERPRDPLSVHVTPPLPEVGSSHQASAF